MEGVLHKKILQSRSEGQAGSHPACLLAWQAEGGTYVGRKDNALWARLDDHLSFCSACDSNIIGLVLIEFFFEFAFEFSFLCSSCLPCSSHQFSDHQQCCFAPVLTFVALGLNISCFFPNTIKPPQLVGFPHDLGFCIAPMLNLFQQPLQPPAPTLLVAIHNTSAVWQPAHMIIDTQARQPSLHHHSRIQQSFPTGTPPSSECVIMYDGTYHVSFFCSTVCCCSCSRSNFCNVICTW